MHCLDINASQLLRKKGIKYFYKKDNGRYIKVDGDNKSWELSECIKQIFNENDPIRRNIELFIKLRNKIEHRNLPGIDQELMGECQALVLNFEEWLVNEYGQKASLIDILFVPIQPTSGVRVLPITKNEKRIINFIKEYRNLLAPEIINSQQYAFKAFLIPKIGNHRSSSDVAIEFVKFDESNPGEMAKYDKAIIGIKEKQIPVANQNLHRPSMVLMELQKRGVSRTLNWHTKMWQKYKVRPSSDASNKITTKSEYCIFDKAHNDYLYTDAWIELIAKR